jgi:hypothetical protein
MNSATTRRLLPRFLPYREKRKIMERKTKIRKREIFA